MVNSKSTLLSMVLTSLSQLAPKDAQMGHPCSLPFFPLYNPSLKGDCSGIGGGRGESGAFRLRLVLKRQAIPRIECRLPDLASIDRFRRVNPARQGSLA